MEQRTVALFGGAREGESHLFSVLARHGGGAPILVTYVPSLRRVGEVVLIS